MSWTSANRMTKSHTTWLHVPSAQLPPGVPGHRHRRGRTRGCCNATLRADQRGDPEARLSSGMGWDVCQGGCILSHLHVRPRGPGLVRTLDDDIGSQKWVPE